MPNRSNSAAAQSDVDRARRATGETELETLAEAQGVLPVESPGQLRGDFWPEDDLDAFLSAVREWRQKGRDDAPCPQP